MRTCIRCGVTMLLRRPRCIGCEKRYQAVRNARPSRQQYRDPVYRSLVPSGYCHWGCGRRADTREHLRSGAIVYACRSCNSSRKERVIVEH